MGDMDNPGKRNASPELVTNPFIKKRNLEWLISPPPPSDTQRRWTQSQACEDKVSGEAIADTAQPPEGRGQPGEAVHRDGTQNPISPSGKNKPSESALIESHQIQITDHVSYFSQLLATHTPENCPPNHPRLLISAYKDLYIRCFNSPSGAHFVVTQHDHPVAGPHYDLRLQINETSSCSWAIMYGLPGDPNSTGKSGRTGSGVLRNATETRVHCLWNHLVETGGLATGSLLIWDTGEYEVLQPFRNSKRHQTLDSQESTRSEAEPETESGDGGDGAWSKLSQQERLARAFAARKIRLRLHGTRLPKQYVVNLRLSTEEDAAGRAKAVVQAVGDKPRRKRRRVLRTLQKKNSTTGPDTSSEGEGSEEEKDTHDAGPSSAAKATSEGLSEMDKELREIEDEQVRLTNAYMGALNTIGSIHQRKWFLSLDREACGYVRTTRQGRVWWARDDVAGEEEEEGERRLKWPFYVRGPDHERSVVTGRLGKDVLKDEGVEGYVGRKGWRPIMK